VIDSSDEEDEKAEKSVSVRKSVLLTAVNEEGQEEEEEEEEEEISSAKKSKPSACNQRNEEVEDMAEGWSDKKRLQSAAQKTQDPNLSGSSVEKRKSSKVSGKPPTANFKQTRKNESLASVVGDKTPSGKATPKTKFLDHAFSAQKTLSESAKRTMMNTSNSTPSVHNKASSSKSTRKRKVVTLTLGSSSDNSEFKQTPPRFSLSEPKKRKIASEFPGPTSERKSKNAKNRGVMLKCVDKKQATGSSSSPSLGMKSKYFTENEHNSSMFTTAKRTSSVEVKSKYFVEDKLDSRKAANTSQAFNILLPTTSSDPDFREERVTATCSSTADKCESEWSCSACTFSNSSLLPYCELCETPRKKGQQANNCLSSPLYTSTQTSDQKSSRKVGRTHLNGGIVAAEEGDNSSDEREQGNEKLVSRRSNSVRKGSKKARVRRNLALEENMGDKIVPSDRSSGTCNLTSFACVSEMNSACASESDPQSDPLANQVSLSDVAVSDVNGDTSASLFDSFKSDEGSRCDDNDDDVMDDCEEEESREELSSLIKDNSFEDRTSRKISDVDDDDDDDNSVTVVGKYGGKQSCLDDSDEFSITLCSSPESTENGENKTDRATNVETRLHIPKSHGKKTKGLVIEESHLRAGQNMKPNTRVCSSKEMTGFSSLSDSFEHESDTDAELVKAYDNTITELTEKKDNDGDNSDGELPVTKAVKRKRKCFELGPEEHKNTCTRKVNRTESRTPSKELNAAMKRKTSKRGEGDDIDKDDVASKLSKHGTDTRRQKVVTESARDQEVASDLCEDRLDCDLVEASPDEEKLHVEQLPVIKAKQKKSIETVSLNNSGEEEAVMKQKKSIKTVALESSGEEESVCSESARGLDRPETTCSKMNDHQESERMNENAKSQDSERLNEKEQLQESGRLNENAQPNEGDTENVEVYSFLQFTCSVYTGRIFVFDEVSFALASMSAYAEIICPCTTCQTRLKKYSPDALTPPSGSYSPSLSLETGMSARWCLFLICSC
jgi:hypothetical protein